MSTCNNVNSNLFCWGDHEKGHSSVRTENSEDSVKLDLRPQPSHRALGGVKEQIQSHGHRVRPTWFVPALLFLNFDPRVARSNLLVVDVATKL